MAHRSNFTRHSPASLGEFLERWTVRNDKVGHLRDDLAFIGKECATQARRRESQMMTPLRNEKAIQSSRKDS